MDARSKIRSEAKAIVAAAGKRVAERAVAAVSKKVRKVAHGSKFVDDEASDEDGDAAAEEDDSPTASDMEFIDDSADGDKELPISTYRASLLASAPPVEGAHARAKAAFRDALREVPLPYENFASSRMLNFIGDEAAPPRLPSLPGQAQSSAAGSSSSARLKEWYETEGKSRTYYDDAGLLRHKEIKCNCLDASGQRTTAAKVFKMPPTSDKVPHLANKIVCTCPNNILNGPKGCGMFVPESTAMQQASRSMSYAISLRAAARVIKESKPTEFEAGKAAQVTAAKETVSYLYELARQFDVSK